jgi:hypothetical protein
MPVFQGEAGGEVLWLFFLNLFLSVTVSGLLVSIQIDLRFSSPMLAQPLRIDRTPFS